MNEKKIQALAEQANLGPCCESQAVAIKKFAELIVRECADVANHKMKDLIDSIICEEDIDAEVFVGNKIRTHFGVEE